MGTDLAHGGYLEDPAFVNYLAYLRYWKEPGYSRYLLYPLCLYYLDLLQHPEFRLALRDYNFAATVEEQTLLHYAFYHTNKVKTTLREQTETGRQGKTTAVP
jgi:mediator of RNA polymerase II transcription subunit 31